MCGDTVPQMFVAEPQTLGAKSPFSYRGSFGAIS